MRQMVKAFSKEFFGAGYEAAGKSLATGIILFLALRAADFQMKTGTFVLYLTSAFFSAGIMWRTLCGNAHMETLGSILLLPHDNRRLVYSYVAVLGSYTLITKTFPIWTLFLAVGEWSGAEAGTAVFCGISACCTAAALWFLFRSGRRTLGMLWAAAVFMITLYVRRTMVVLFLALVSGVMAARLLYSADAYDFLQASFGKSNKIWMKERGKRKDKGKRGKVFLYLARYLLANKNYLVNTVGLWGVACVLPLMFREIQGLNTFPLGLAVLCMNTPLCTLLSGDPELEQAIRAFPGQKRYFCLPYVLFLCAVNSLTEGIYICGWKAVLGGISAADVWTGAVFSAQSALFSVLLEWKYPLRGWKTETDLWHHPRKYLVPGVILLAGAFLGLWPSFLWLWTAILAAEWGILVSQNIGVGA